MLEDQTVEVPGMFRILKTMFGHYNVQRYMQDETWHTIKQENEDYIISWDTPELASAYLTGLTHLWDKPLTFQECMMLVVNEV